MQPVRTDRYYETSDEPFDYPPRNSCQIAGSTDEACAMSLKIKCTAGNRPTGPNLRQANPLYSTNDLPDYTSRKIALCLCSNRVTPKRPGRTTVKQLYSAAVCLRGINTTASGEIECLLYSALLVLNLLLQQRDGVEQLFGPRRAPWNVNVDGYDLVYAL